MLDLAALSALCRLDVPDLLVRPMTSDVLAQELDVDRARLERLLRYSATRGWVRIDRRGRVRPTRVTAFLRRDHPGGWRAWIEFASGGEIAAAAGGLDAALVRGGDAFAAANGAPFFDWMAVRPDRHGTFDAAMAAGGQMHGLLLARALDWSGSRDVCDVGGGDGALLDVLLAEHGHLSGTVLELPEVAERVRQRPRLRAVGGDAFTAVPSGCDTYLLVNVLHDWDDVAAARLLRNVADAARASDRRAAGQVAGQVIVVEAAAHARPRDDLAIRADLLMLALTPGGRERSIEEITALGAVAGLRRRQVRRLASGDVAIVLVPDERATEGTCGGPRQGLSAGREPLADVRSMRSRAEETTMSGNAKRAKGRAKQAIGAITGDKDLQKEGRTDERVGELENKVDDVTDAVNEKIDEKIDEAVDKGSGEQ